MMTDQPAEPNSQAVVKEKSNVSIVWLLPVVAALIGIWLIYKSIAEAGLMVTIEFPPGANIIPNETEVRFEGVLFGVVKGVTLTEDLDGVLANIELDSRTAGVLQDDTEFWLVEPELSISRVAGLETLISGKYITFQWGEKTGQMAKSEISKLKPQKFHYKALPVAPPKPRYLGGLSLTLESENASSMTRGTPILFHKLRVGTVEGIRLAENGIGVLIDIYIDEAYAHLIKSDTRFWSVSGLSVGGGLGNIKFKMESLTSLMIGGITFSPPSGRKDSISVEWGGNFLLYPDQDAALTKGVTIKIDFDVSQDVVVGTEIKYKGIQVGEVTDIDLSDDLKTIHAVAVLDEGIRALPREGSAFWLVKPELGLASTRNLETLLTGKYIAVRPGDGPITHQFTGLSEAPLRKQKSTGLNIVLTSPSLGSLKKGVTVLYRDVEVGKVKGFELAKNAQEVFIYVNIEEQYRDLIHDNTRFWNVSGIGLDFSLFGGAKVRTDSLESLLEGGIALATPDNEAMGELAKEGAQFSLQSEALDEWKTWKPSIEIGEAPQP